MSNNEITPQHTSTYKLRADGKYIVFATIVVYVYPEVECREIACIDVSGEYSNEVLKKIQSALNKNDALLNLIDAEPENNKKAYDVYCNIDALSPKNIEEQINETLKGTPYKAFVVETEDAYEDDGGAPLYNYLAIGRYCDLSSVKEELKEFAVRFVEPQESDDKKVAKLVSFSLVTRVVVEKDANEEEVISAAIDQLLHTEGMMKDKLECGIEDVEDDTECPYGTFDNENLKKENQ